MQQPSNDNAISSLEVDNGGGEGNGGRGEFYLELNEVKHKPLQML